MYPDGKKFFQLIQCRSPLLEPPSSCLRNSRADWLQYLLDLNLLYLALLQAKVQVTPHDNLDALGPFNTVEWDWLAAEYIRETCPSFLYCQEATVVKMVLS
jgi:hypothetical protein